MNAYPADLFGRYLVEHRAGLAELKKNRGYWEMRFLDAGLFFESPSLLGVLVRAWENGALGD